MKVEKIKVLFTHSHLDRKNGVLTPVNSQPTLSQGPCYITIDNKGRNLHTANYNGGSISSFHTNGEGNIATANSVLFFTGSGPDSICQERSHLHSIMYSPDGRFIFASDLGSQTNYIVWQFWIHLSRVSHLYSKIA